MAGQRKIIRTQFSVDTMNELSVEEARKYFILTFFVPIAYSKWENFHVGDVDQAVLHVIATADFNHYYPYITMSHSTAEAFPNMDLGVTDLNQEINATNRVLGEPVNATALSNALKRAFGDCFVPECFRNYGWCLFACPLIATLTYNGDNKMALDVIVKNTSTVPHKKVLYSQVKTGNNVATYSHVYNRFFNIFTGEWIGLCPDDDKQCTRCKQIRSSTACKNAYDDSRKNP